MTSSDERKRRLEAAVEQTWGRDKREDEGPREWIEVSAPRVCVEVKALRVREGVNAPQVCGRVRMSWGVLCLTC